MDLNKYAHLEVLLAPAAVLAFAGLLSVMYGWVGTMNSLGSEIKEIPESPETRIVAGVRPAPAPHIEGLSVQTGIGNGAMVLKDVNGRIIPSGIGGAQGQIRLNNFTAPTGIGNGQILLSGETTIPTGIGNNQMQLINDPPISAGIGGQIRMINQTLVTEKPYLGLEVSAIGEVMARQLGLPSGTGLFIKDVIPHTPASKAGFMSGDILIRCDRKAVSTLDQLSRIISLKKPGEVIKCVALNHNGKKKSYYAKLSNGPTGFRQAAAAGSSKGLWLGMEVQTIDAIMKHQLKLKNSAGVIVSFMNSQSPAQNSGLMIGDIILSVNGVNITDADQFKSIVTKQMSPDGLSFTFQRNRQKFNIMIKPQKQPKTHRNVPVVPQAEMLIEGSWIGMDVSELTPGEASEFGLPTGTRGIIVNDVESPPATMVGFQTGDCVTAVNSTPTLTMKQFVKATKGQTGAVLDIIRGNRHMYITVPPPGMTQQGTLMNEGQINPLKQVAAAMPDTIGIVAILSTGESLNSPVGSDNNMVIIMLFDTVNNRHIWLTPVKGESIIELLKQNNVQVLIASSIGNRTKNELDAHGLTIYSGVTGHVIEAFKLYRAGKLVAMG